MYATAEAGCNTGWVGSLKWPPHASLWRSEVMQVAPVDSLWSLPRWLGETRLVRGGTSRKSAACVAHTVRLQCEPTSANPREPAKVADRSVDQSVVDMQNLSAANVLIAERSASFGGLILQPLLGNKGSRGLIEKREPAFSPNVELRSAPRDFQSASLPE